MRIFNQRYAYLQPALYVFSSNTIDIDNQNDLAKNHFIFAKNLSFLAKNFKFLAKTTS